MKCCDIKSGDLNKRIAIQKTDETLDEYGGFEQSIITLAQPWAKIKNATANEQYSSEKLDARYTHSFIIRYRTGLDEADFIVYNGETYNIRTIVDIEERRKFLMIRAEKGVAL